MITLFSKESDKCFSSEIFLHEIDTFTILEFFLKLQEIFLNNRYSIIELLIIWRINNFSFIDFFIQTFQIFLFFWDLSSFLIKELLLLWKFVTEINFDNIYFGDILILIFLIRRSNLYSLCINSFLFWIYLV